MFPILFQIGPFTLHTYGLMVAVGFLVGVYVLRRQWSKNGWADAQLDRLVLSLMLVSLLGARVVYFAVSGFEYLRADLLSFFKIWEGGLVFYGGVLAGLLFLVFYAKSHSYNLLEFLDTFVPPLLIAHAIGRIGCFAAGCCYGKPTASPISVTFTHPESLALLHVPLHPAQLYESFGTLLLFFGAITLQKRNLTRGSMVVYYLLCYGALRFLLEFLRGDNRGVVLGGLFPSQWVSLASIAIGAFLLPVLKPRHATR